MICKKCKNYIPEDSLYCLNCGEKVELVNEDIVDNNYLSDQVKSIIEEDEYRDYIENKNNHDDYMYDSSDDNVFKNFSQNNKSNNLNINDKKKKKIKYAFFSSLFILIILIFSTLLYRGNSYSYNVSKGDVFYKKSKYEKSITYYNKAIRINENKARPLVGKAKAYIMLEDYDLAHECLNLAIDIEPDYPNSYIELAKLYEDEDNSDAITELFINVTNKRVLEKCKDYYVEKPKTNIKEGKYTKEIELKLNSKNNDIYYTLDGTIPTVDSELYVNPIKLNNSDIYYIQAIAVNNKGIKSDVSKFEFELELPIIYLPTISPSTGRYSNEIEIKITDIPSGFKAYYTLDGTIPDEESEVYKSPFKINKEYISEHNLDKSNIILNVILISKEKNRSSDIANRSYEIYY